MGNRSPHVLLRGMGTGQASKRTTEAGLTQRMYVFTRGLRIPLVGNLRKKISA